MTLPRLAAMAAHWKHNPPLYLSIASLLRSFGGKSSGAPTKTSAENEKFFQEIQSSPERE